MIKTGIWKAEQLVGPDSVRGIFGISRRVSISLYEQLCAERPDLAELVLLRHADSRGAFKRTYRNRFDKFDDLALEKIKAQFHAGATLRLHDMGVADGRTSFDFFAKVNGAFPLVEYVASDFESDIELVTLENTTVAINKAGHILEITWPPFVFNVAKHESFFYFPLNKLAYRFAQKAAAKTLASPSSTRRQSRLSCPDAINLASADARFKLTEHDMLGDDQKGPFEVVRAMNVVNFSYFSPDEVRAIVRRVHASLADGGLFIVGSNDGAGSEVRGGVYQRSGTKFVKIHQKGAVDAHDAAVSLDTNRAEINYSIFGR